MLSLLKFLIISNLVSVILVVAFERFTGLFGLSYWSDYAFFVVMILWGTAVLFFIHPPESGFGSDKAERVAGSMVDSSVADEIDSKRFSSNTLFCIKLFVSGLPSFLIAVLTSLIP